VTSLLCEDRSVTALPETASPEHRSELRPLALLAGAGCCALGTGILAAGVTVGAPAAVASSAVLQAGLLASWWRAMTPAGPLSMLLVAGAVALAADVLIAAGAGAGALTGVLALGVVATIAAQLARGVARTMVVQSYAGTLLLAAAMVAYALLAAAMRADGADPVLLVVLSAGGGLVLARLVDLLVARPRLVAGVRRGGLGLVLGLALGIGLALAYARLATGEPSGEQAALLGGGAALVAGLVDVGGQCLLAGREPRSWSAGLAPLLALVAVVTVAFVALPSVVG